MRKSLKVCIAGQREGKENREQEWKKIGSYLRVKYLKNCLAEFAM